MSFKRAKMSRRCDCDLSNRDGKRDADRRAGGQYCNCVKIGDSSTIIARMLYQSAMIDRSSDSRRQVAATFALLHVHVAAVIDASLLIAIFQPVSGCRPVLVFFAQSRSVTTSEYPGHWFRVKALFGVIPGHRARSRIAAVARRGSATS